MNRSQAGLSLIPKLKYEHLHLTNFSKMRVDLAAQVNINFIVTLFVTLCLYPFQTLLTKGSVV